MAPYTRAQARRVAHPEPIWGWWGFGAAVQLRGHARGSYRPIPTSVSMKVPTCKLCQKAHWSYEGHYTGMSAINPDYIREMAAGALGRESSASEVGKAAAPVAVARVPKTETSAAEPSRSDKTCNACNKPLHNRGKVCNACRQRAYRERSK